MMRSVRRPGTYSIVARDPDTLELGVAVQSHWFSVGSVVPWLLPGVGAVATQSIPVPGGGPRILESLASMTAGASRRWLLAADGEPDVRQVAVVDGRGEAAVHTGAGCIPFAGDASGDGWTCQANMMASEAVWGGRADAFTVAQRGIAH